MIKTRSYITASIPTTQDKFQVQFVDITPIQQTTQNVAGAHKRKCDKSWKQMIQNGTR